MRLAVEALQRYDAKGGERDAPRRRDLLQNAAYLLTAYVIQREALGMRDNDVINAEFGITPEIWNSMGVVSHN